MRKLPANATRSLLSLLVWVLLVMVQQQALADTPDAQQQLKAAEQVYRQQGPKSGLADFEKLRLEYQQSDDTDSEGTAIRFIGEIQWRLGDFEKADQFLQMALKMKRENGDRLQEGKTLNVLGLLNWDLADFELAKEYFRQGTAIAQDIGNNKLAGAILNNLSLVHDELGDYYVSLEQYQQVLELYKDTGFLRGEGDTLGNIGGVYLLLGRYAEALSHYEKAMAISEQLQSVSSMSQDHGNIALSRFGLGQTVLALQHFDHAIDLAGQAGMRQDEAYWQRGRAMARIRSGKYDLALEDYRQALGTYEAVTAPAETLETMHDMGRLHLLLGDSATAETYFTNAMNKAREIGLARGVTINLLALGDLQARQRAWEKAGAYYQQASVRTRESGEMPWFMQSLLSLSGIHKQQGEYDLALSEAQQALSIAGNIDARPEIAAATYSLAELERLTGSPETARIAFERAEVASQGMPDPDLLWRIHYGKALVLDALEDQKGAISELLKAVKLIEGVRDRLEEQRFRAGYVQDKYQVYVELVRLQAETGQVGEAFSTAERLRARSFVELVENNARAGGVETGRDEEIALRERIRQLRSVMAEEQALGRPDQRQLAMNVYSIELLEAEREFELLLENRQTTRNPIGRSAGSLANVPGFAEVQVQLAENEALIEYVVGNESVIIFVLTRETLLTESVPMGQLDLDSRIELLRDLIRHPDNERWIKPARELGEALFSPIEQRGLLTDVTHLYLVPHGSLNYLPFALLPNGKLGGKPDRQLVIENYTLVYLPTAAALVRKSHLQRGSKSLLAVAPTRSHLKYALAEAQSVNDMFKPDSSLLLGEAATESAFKQQAENFSILHLATHGYFNKLNPLLSGLELEMDSKNDGQLELYEILELRLNAELVTLSACQTALGSGHFAETPAGDDFVGLTRAFIYAGSQSVLATLWRVDDHSTKDLMQDFYTRMTQTKDNQTQAVALAKAQRKMRSSKQFRHPYYWAPFILVGDTAEKRHQQG